MSLITDLRDRFITKPVVEKLTEVMEKAATNANQIERYTVPMGANQQLMNNRKPGATVTYDQLRNMSRFHDVSRSCINIRKRQLTNLEWDIVPTDDADAKRYVKDIPVLKAWFKTIGGYNMKMRRLLEIMVEDYLVIDAVVLAKRKTRDNTFLGFVPVDGTTIKLLVDQYGGTPMPPQYAYEQWIRGSKVGEFKADQIVYDILNPRSDSPYGFSVMESLIMNVEQSLKVQMYNAAYFTDGTTPEGFFGVPDNWTKDQIQQYQEFFDALIGGDPRLQRRLKFVPSGGSGYTATKTFDFKAMEPYMMWLMRVTASLFGVMPQELGFTDEVNKSNGLEQTDISKRNSIVPMTNAISEIFTQVLQTETIGLMEDGKVTSTMGPFPELKFVFKGIDVKDERLESEVTERQIKSGLISIDEWRKDNGLEPIGMSEPFVLAGNTVVLVKDIPTISSNTANPPEPVEVVQDAPEPKEEEKKPDTEEEQSEALETSPEQELKRYEKKALTDIKEGRPFRKFRSTVVDPITLQSIEADLQDCTTREEVKALFKSWNEAQEKGITRDVLNLLGKIQELN